MKYQEGDKVEVNTGALIASPERTDTWRPAIVRHATKQQCWLFPDMEAEGAVPFTPLYVFHYFIRRRVSPRYQKLLEAAE